MANNSSHPAASRPGLFSRLHPHKLRGWVAGVGLAVMALTSFIVVGQSGPPSIAGQAIILRVQNILATTMLEPAIPTTMPLPKPHARA